MGHGKNFTQQLQLIAVSVLTALAALHKVSYFAEPDYHLQ